MRIISSVRPNVGDGTPPRRQIPGEVSKKEGDVSPSEDRKFDAVLSAYNLPMDRVREIGESDPELMNAILEMAASKVVMRKRPMFGIKGRASAFLENYQCPLQSGALNNPRGGVYTGAGFLNPVNLLRESNICFGRTMSNSSPNIYNNCTFNITGSSKHNQSLVDNSQRCKKRRRVVKEVVEESQS